MDQLPPAKKATDDSGSSDDEDGSRTLSRKKQVPVKPLPVKTQARKPKEKAQEEVVKLLGKIVSNQEVLVKHHTASSSLTQAISLFKENYSADLTAVERFKFQKYLKDNSELFILMDDEEMKTCIDDCLN